MTTRIHVNGQNLKNNPVNAATGKRNAVFVAYDSDTKRTRKGTHVEIAGPSRLVYSPTLESVGSYCAFAWIETDAPVKVTHGAR